MRKDDFLQAKLKTWSGLIPDLFLLQNDKNLKLFDKYACQK